MILNYRLHSPIFPLVSLFCSRVQPRILPCIWLFYLFGLFKSVTVSQSALDLDFWWVVVSYLREFLPAWVCWVSSHDHTNVTHLWRECHRSDAVCLPCASLSGRYLILIPLTTVAAHLPHSGSAYQFLHHNGTVFPFVIMKYLGRDTLRICT